MNILITGSDGQLGSEIKNISDTYKTQFNFFFTNSRELDICQYDLLREYVIKNKINAIINCAAYTKVDNAEKEVDSARNVNVNGVKNLVDVMELAQGKLIHISTDYVFDGNKKTPYNESDVVNPIGVYGKTKREGEIVILNSDIEAIVLRTSWLYSIYGSNFVKTILKFGKEKRELKIVSDQIGSPTFAKDLAIVCLDILSKTDKKIDKKGKIYHYSNEGEVSWYDFGKAIIEIGSVNCEVIPIFTEDYPTLVKRPKYSVLNLNKLKKDFDVTIPYWKDSLINCIAELKSINKDV